MLLSSRSAGLSVVVDYSQSLAATLLVIAEPGSYASLQHVCSLSGDLGTPLRSVYLQQNGALRAFYYTTLFNPRVTIFGASSDAQCGAHHVGNSWA